MNTTLVMLAKAWQNIFYLFLVSIVLTIVCPIKASALSDTCSSMFNTSIQDLNDEKTVLKRVQSLFAGPEMPWHNGADSKTSYIVRDKTQFPMRTWMKEQIQVLSQSNSYTFVEAGASKLEADVEADEKIVRKHILSSLFDHPIEFVISGERKESINELLKLKWAFHDAVIASYANHPHKRKYLSITGLSDLVFQNSDYEKHDVFAVLKSSNKKNQDLTKSQIRDSVIVTAQLTYASPKHQVSFTSPQPYNFLLQYKFQMSKSKSMWLPFIDRMTMPSIQHSNDGEKNSYPIPSIDVSQFMQKLDQDFSGLKLAEINRFAKPMNDQPDVLRDYVLLKLLLRAEEKGVGVLFASTDRATRRLFLRDYFFSDYSTIERPLFNNNKGIFTGELSETEYLLYIKVGSPEYQQLKQKLQIVVDAQIQASKKPYLD